MASLFSKGLREVSPPGFFSLLFGKLNAGSAQPVFTTDTTKTSYCAIQTQAEGLYIDSRVIMTFISL